jgi:purine nucleoside permease
VSDPLTLRVLVCPAVHHVAGLSELRPWLDRFDPTRELSLPGLVDPLRVTDDGVGLVATGIGKADAATTVATLFASPRVDCSGATVLTVGIAGGPPDVGPLGSVVVGDRVVDWDRKHRVDDDADPVELLGWRERDHVYDLDPALADLATAAARGTTLREVGGASPAVTRGTVLSGDEFWHGARLAEQAEGLVAAYDAGRYRVTEMEAAGTAVVLDRVGALGRYAVVRAAANYDRPPADRDARENLDLWSGEHANDAAVENAYRVGRALVERLLAR